MGFEHWSRFKPESDRERYLLEVIQKLEKELEHKTYKKPGQRAYDNKDIVTQVFERYLNGGSLSEIAEHLNSSGVKTKRGGSIWYKSTVKFMLQNRDYIDRYVTQEVFDRVQDMLKSNRKRKA